MRLILLHNPSAGDEDHDRRRLESVLADAGHAIEYRSLDDDGWAKALDEGGELIVVAGGDGSVRKLLTAIGRSPTAMTLFPTGSANNIARTLGFETDDPLRFVAGWETASRRALDLWQVTSAWGESRCVEAVGGGLFAEVLARAEDVRGDPGGDEKVDLGLGLLAQALEKPASARWEIELDGERFRDQLLGLEAMNMREIGPNLPLAPEADPGDGLLDVVLVRPEDRAPLAEYVAARLRDEDPPLPSLDIRRCRELVFEPPEDAGVHVDDVLPAWDAGAPRWVAVSRADVEVEVLVPAGGTAVTPS